MFWQTMSGTSRARVALCFVFGIKDTAETVSYWLTHRRRGIWDGTRVAALTTLNGGTGMKRLG